MGQNPVRLRICIAIFAQMPAGIIGADIACKVAGAFCPGASLFWHLQMPADGLLIVADPHTAATVGAEGGKFVTLRARLHSHPVCGSNLNDLLAERQALRLGDLPGLRKVAPNLGIEVDEADHDRLRIAVEGRCNLIKSVNLVLHRIPIRQ